MGEIPTDMLMKVHNEDWVEFMKELPNDCVDFCMTSPPYHSVRVYEILQEKVYDGDPECNHEWGPPIKRTKFTLSNKDFNARYFGRIDRSKKKQEGGGRSEGGHHGRFCLKCKTAWKGQLGLEPTVDLYIKHLCDGFDELKRILKPTGSFYLNIGDTYIDKQLQLVPHRVSHEMNKRGWCLRNAIIWYKPAAAPYPGKDRLQNTYEMVYHFVKSKRGYYYNLDEVRLPHKTKPPKQKEESSHTQMSLYNDEIEEGKRNWKEEMKEGKRRGGTDEHRQAMLGGLASGKVKNHPLGKNPGDVIQLSDKKYNPIPVTLRNKVKRSKHLEDHERTAVLNELLKGLSEGKRILEFHIRGQGKGVHGQQELSGRAKELKKKGWVIMWYHPDGKNPGDFWSINTVGTSEEHYAVMPVELCLQPIMSSCPPNGTIFEPFVGCGTTFIAAEELKLDDATKWNFKWLGTELSKKYCKIANNKLKPYVNQEKVL